ncbi:MAG TPA: HAD family hydrolase [Chthoniobacteraceae bacterium]|jgi:HAD superfamily hydrolase (TIGR01509 family)
MIRYVIFDVDGTLIDSVDLHAHAWLEALRHFGKDAPFEKVREQIGKGSDQLMPVFWSEEEVRERGKEITKWRTELFAEKYMPQVKGFPKVRELVEFLLAKGKRVALASSAAGEELSEYKKRAGIEDLIKAETSADDVERSKPHPDIFAAALEELGNPPVEEVIVIGDTPYDIEAAAKIDLRTIAVLCGGFPKESLSGAVAIFRDPADLLARYEESPLA